MPFVYFIQEDKADVFKIGFSKNSVSGRLSGLQVGNSRKLRVFGTIEVLDSTIELEKHLHGVLCKHRLNGEWFKLHPQHVVEYINHFNTKPETYKATVNVEPDDIGKPPDPIIKTVYRAAPWKLFLFQANGLVLLLIVIMMFLIIMVAGFIAAPDTQKMLSDLFYPKP